MIDIRSGVSAIALAGATALLPLAAGAQTTLRLDEVAVGELDPAKATDYADSILMFNAYDTLLLPARGGGGMEPHLAVSWAVEGTTFTFTLREDVTFASGNPLTAADVVFSYERLIALGQGFSHLFRDHVASVEASGDHTVVFTLNQPYAPFLAGLTRLQVVDSATVLENLEDGDYGDLGDYGQAYLSANAAGTGAYAVTAHNPQEETTFARNEGYFLAFDGTAPDVVRLRYGLEGATVRTLIARGEHDIASQWLPPEIVRGIAEGDGTQLLFEGGMGGFYIKLNTQKPPLDDVHCRRALAHALNYASMLALVQVTDEVAQGAPANGPLPLGMLGSDPDLAFPSQDMERAQAELDACAHDAGDHTLEISWIAEVPIEERFALLMQSNFQQLGFGTEVVRVPWALFTERATSVDSTPHISQLFVNATTPDPDALIYNMYHSEVAGTWQSVEWLQNDEVDRLLEAGRAELDQEARAAIYRELSALLVDLQPTIYAYESQSVFPASDRVAAPSLADPTQSYLVNGMNFMFRHMSMQ